MARLETFGNTLKDLFDRIVGPTKKGDKAGHGLKPGDRGYLQAIFGVTIDEDKIRPTPRPPIAANCKRYGETQRAAKIARKGHRMKKRQRREGPYAVVR
jgi:hypothetical protein